MTLATPLSASSSNSSHKKRPRASRCRGRITADPTDHLAHLGQVKWPVAFPDATVLFSGQDSFGESKLIGHNSVFPPHFGFPDAGNAFRFTCPKSAERTRSRQQKRTASTSVPISACGRFSRAAAWHDKYAQI